MRKIFLTFIFLAVFCCLPCLQTNTKTYAEQETFSIRAYGDSISAGYGLEDYDNYLNDVSIITQGSYPQVFSEKYVTNFNASVIGKGVSGDTSSDLLADLNAYINKTAEDLEDFKSTDVFTVCIGANNVLGVVTDNIQDYLTDSLSHEDFEALLDAGVAQFKQDYPQILSAFGESKVVIMTIYNPFKYIKLTDIQVSSSLGSFIQSTIKSTISSLDTKFQTMLSSSMEALQEINNTIRESASENVYVADIWELFKGFSQSDYENYICADLSKITINSISTVFEDISSNIGVAFDPHPTSQGHNVIAQEHSNAFKYFELSTSESFEDLKDKGDVINLNLTTFETGSYSFKLYKQTEQTKTLILSSQAKTFAVESSLIEGSGDLFVEVYDDNQLVYTTNKLAFNVQLNTYQITSQQLLTGVKHSNETVSVNVVAESVNNYNFKLYKKSNSSNVLIDQGKNQFTISAENLVGEGYLFVEVYKNNNLVYTTNSLNYNIELANFNISCDKNLNNLTNESSSFAISVSTNSNYEYEYKLFKKVNTSILLLQTNNLGVFDVNVSQLTKGEGSLFVEVYYNNEKLSTTQFIDYKLTINDTTTDDDTITGGTTTDDVVPPTQGSNNNDSNQNNSDKKSDNQAVIVFVVIGVVIVGAIIASVIVLVKKRKNRLY